MGNLALFLLEYISASIYKQLFLAQEHKIIFL